ncbi:hypothetical protein [Brevundimonas sp. FT23042]|uniref:hypothetical protein n=1 Tax=Brevundimonas sp. FT23042 TaxID=3393749 RepID=UPI003B58775F
MGRVPVARFTDFDTASAATLFLGRRGVDATLLDHRGHAAPPSPVSVLVEEERLAEAQALLARAYRRDLPEDDEAGVALMAALHGEGGTGVRVTWRHHLPLLIVGGAALAGLVIALLILPAIRALLPSG